MFENTQKTRRSHRDGWEVALIHRVCVCSWEGVWLCPAINRRPSWINIDVPNVRSEPNCWHWLATLITGALGEFLTLTTAD